MRHSTRRSLEAVGFGLGFSLAVMGLAALASEMGDPWGVIVLVVLAPGMPLLGNRGDSLLPVVLTPGCLAAGALRHFSRARTRRPAAGVPSRARSL